MACAPSRVCTVWASCPTQVKLLEELPSTLRLQLAVILNQGYLTRVQMFASADSRSIALLSLALVQKTYLPLELVMTEGSCNDFLHFVRSGTLQVSGRIWEQPIFKSSLQHQRQQCDGKSKLRQPPHLASQPHFTARARAAHETDADVVHRRSLSS